MSINVTVDLSDDSVSGFMKSIDRYSLRILSANSSYYNYSLTLFTSIGRNQYTFNVDAPVPWYGVYFVDSNSSANQFTIQQFIREGIVISTGTVAGIDRNQVLTGSPPSGGSCITGSPPGLGCIFQNPYNDKTTTAMVLKLRIESKPRGTSIFVLTNLIQSATNNKSSLTSNSISSLGQSSFLDGNNGGSLVSAIIVIILIVVILLLIIFYVWDRSRTEKRIQDMSTTLRTGIKNN